MPVKRRWFKRRDDSPPIPPHVEAWFAGEAQEWPWEAAFPADEEQVRQWWARWGKQNPKAEPPGDAPWLGLRRGGALGPLPSQKGSAD